MFPKRKHRCEIAKEAFKQLPVTINQMKETVKQKFEEHRRKKDAESKYTPILQDQNYKSNEL